MHWEHTLALVSDTTKRRRVELFGTAAKDYIDWDVGPGVVLHTVEVSVNDSAVLATVASVGNERRRGGIRNVRSRYDADVSTSETMEHLCNGLDLRVVERVLARVGIDVQAVDRALVTSVESSGGVGRVGDETVNGVGHLVAENGELVHGHGSLVLSVDALMTDQACGRNHVGGHTISDKEDDVLSFALLGQVTNEPFSLCLAAVVIVERSSVLAGLVKSNTTVGFGGDIDETSIFGVASEKVCNVSMTIQRFCSNMTTCAHPRTK